ncbi:MAG TPA: hypothetical protein DCG57_02380 [Candidatus Riflebacteria bacterium]|nr:hypothetical protein [Candidatus Riflebacteria bacterium]
MGLRHRHNYESLVGSLKATERHYLPSCTAGSLDVALVYPNLYSLGMSNLGYLTVHRLLTTTPGVAVERFFPALAAESPLAPPFYSFETGRPLGDFSIIMFSFSYEGDFDKIPGIFAALGIPVIAEERNHHHPLMVAGGAAVASNPQALSRIFDVLVPGEAETTLPSMMEIFLKNGMQPDELAAVPGVWVPATHGEMLAPELIHDINSQPAYAHIVSSQNAFGGAHLLELMRGCPRNCSFCLARAIYHPVRSLQPTRLAEWLDQHPDCSDLGLIAPSLFDHPQIEEIFNMLAQRNIRIRNSSVKWEKLQPKLLEILHKSGVTGLTLAPETGSKRLQTAINKPMNESLFIESVREIFAAGFEQLKLYFVACLPGEEKQDLDATVDFINSVVKASPSAGHVAAAFSLFVPKHRTLWQNKPAPTLQEMKHTVKYLKGELNKLSAQLKTSFASPQEALRQSWLSQAGPELAIEYAREANTCRENRLFSRNQFSALEF